jgi:isopentenyl-diphosphate delta-isomerase
MAEEWVVLVDELDRETGIARKRDVHHDRTPLHRAFSLFLFDAAGRTLLQRRALGKRTWPGIWSNGCCGHPGPGETTLEAANRRCAEELGTAPIEPWIALPDYRYRAELDGIVENEICPVVVARVDPDRLRPNAEEVEETRWMSWSEFFEDVLLRPGGWSPWAVEEARQLDRDPRFRQWLAGAPVEG